MTSTNIQDSVTATPKVGDAVGVENREWYVAIVSNNTEKQCAKKLQLLGFDCYVPTQKETRVWRTGVRNVIDRIVIPARIFVQATEKERKDYIAHLSYVKSFVVNHCKRNKYGKHPVAIIPEEQLQRLKFVLGNADNSIEFEPKAFNLGDKVRVVRGSLTGIEGHIINCDNNTFFAIQVEFLGAAKMIVQKDDLEYVK